MRSGANIDTLAELMEEAIRVDNDLYELALEERLFNQGTRQQDRNDRPRQQQYRRSPPNTGRQRGFIPSTPGSYQGYGAQPMHLNNLNKGRGFRRAKLNEGPKGQHNKDRKKITCYACGKEGHMARDCRSKNKVTRQLNVI